MNGLNDRTFPACRFDQSILGQEADGLTGCYPGDVEFLHERFQARQSVVRSPDALLNALAQELRDAQIAGNRTAGGQDGH